MDFSIRIEGDRDTIRRLNAVGGLLESLPGAMKEIGHYLVAFYAGEMFASQGGIARGKWSRLSPRYEVVKARRWPGRPMLVRTGLMQRSFKFAYSSAHTRIYNPVEYFGYHQTGTSKMPARVMMAITATNRRMMGDIVADHVRRKLAGL